MKPHIVFISYSSKNVDIANTIYNMLESRHISCWMAPYDLITGEDYGASIEEAIRTSQIIVFIFSKFGNKSRWVKSELSIAFSEQKLIIPFKIDNTTPEGIVRMVLTKSQWIEALNESNEHYARLLERINAALDTSVIREKWENRFSKMTSDLKKIPITVLSIILLLFSKYVNEAFLLLNYYTLKDTVLQYSEMTLIMTIVSIIASTSICLFLRNEGRKWNKIVLTTIIIIATSFFAFWEVIRDFRTGETISFSFNLGDSALLFALVFVMIIPAIAAYFFIVRRIPSTLIFFFFYWTLFFGIYINSPWAIISCIPVILLYFHTSYMWYKNISNTALVFLVITISIYLGMNFVNYSTLLYGDT